MKTVRRGCEIRAAVRVKSVQERDETRAVEENDSKSLLQAQASRRKVHAEGVENGKNGESEEVWNHPAGIFCVFFDVNFEVIVKSCTTVKVCLSCLSK